MGENAAEQIGSLRAVLAELDSTSRPAELVFMAIGDALAQALGALQNLEGDFSQLAERLAGNEAGSAATSLRQALDQSAGLTDESSRVLGLLQQLDDTGGSAGRSLAVLGKIVGEVAALAINAKIQAAQVRAVDVDFSVFTTEIARLGELASNAIETAAERLASLQNTIAVAKKAEQDFEQTDARELHAVRGRLEDCINALADRQRRAGNAAAAISRKSRQIVERVAACISALQINDMTSQRIEHVRKAIEALAAILDPGARQTGAEWAEKLDPGRKEAVVAAVCRLQARQLDRAIDEFATAVGQIRTNLAALADDARGTLTEALSLLGARDGQTSFASELKDNVDRASALLDSYARAEEDVQKLIGTVSTGFVAMANDLDAIHSIDADMRVMGLNASLKCARLGNDGRTLGVVAQELRACSRRTEEISRAISTIITQAVEASERLARRSHDEHDGAAALGATMAGSMSAICALGDALDGALDRLRTGCGDAASLLAERSAAIVIDRQMKDVAGRASRRLAEIAGSVKSDPALDASVRDDVHRLLSQHYTMASERIVHDLFAEGADCAPAPTSNAQQGAVAVDDFLF